MASSKGSRGVRSILRIGSLLTSGLLVGGFAGCHSRSSDYELTLPEQPYDDEPDAAIGGDAGSSVRADAAAAPSCTGSDPIAQLFCTLNPQNTTGSTSTTDLTALVRSMGGFPNIANVLSGGLGTGGLGTAQTGTQPSFLDLIETAGGLANIATLLNGAAGQTRGTSTQPSLIDLFAGTNGARATNNAGTANGNLAEILASFGVPFAGPTPAVMTEPTSDQCSAPASQLAQLVCTLQSTNGGAAF